MAIVLVAIAAGNNGGNSGGGGSSGGVAAATMKTLVAIGHRQQSTKSGRGRNGGRDGSSKVTMTMMARIMTVAMATVVMAAFLTLQTTIS